MSRFTCGPATKITSCYLDRKMVAVEEALRAKTVVQGCQCLCNFARRPNFFDLEETRSTNTTASPIIIPPSCATLLRQLQASIDSATLFPSTSLYLCMNSDVISFCPPFSHSSQPSIDRLPTKATVPLMETPVLRHYGRVSAGLCGS